MKTGLEGGVYSKKIIADELKKDLGDLRIHGTHAAVLHTHHKTFNNNGDEYAISGMDSMLRSTVKLIDVTRDGRATKKMMIMQDMHFNILFQSSRYIIPVTLKATIGVPTSSQDNLTLHHSEFLDTVVPNVIRHREHDAIIKHVDTLILRNGKHIRDNLLSAIELERLTDDGEYIAVLKNQPHGRRPIASIKEVKATPGE